MRQLWSRFGEKAARGRLLATATLNCSATAKVSFRNITMCEGSSLTIGEGSIVEGRLACERKGACIVIGRRSFIGNSVLSCATQLEIGDDVLVSWGCSLVDHNSHPLRWTERKDDVSQWFVGQKDWTNVDVKPVKIGDKSWLGFNVGILKGVTVGEGAIVGAGSIVTQDVPAWTIVAGNPAKVIREIGLEDR